MLGIGDERLVLYHDGCVSKRLLVVSAIKGRECLGVVEVCVWDDFSQKLINPQLLSKMTLSLILCILPSLRLSQVN
jgi:hypothetical protein